jgi:hypothetical protein
VLLGIFPLLTKKMVDREARKVYARWNASAPQKL